MASDQRCKGTTSSGDPCAAPAGFVDPSSGYCASHDPEMREMLREAGRRGGRATAKRFRGSGLPAEELGDLQTVEDAQRWLRLIAQAVGERRITHSEGSSMTGAVKAWIRSEDTRLRAADLQELQEQIAELKRSRMKSA